MFYATEEEAVQLSEFCSFSYTVSNLQASTIEFSSKHNENLFFKFRLPRKSNLSLAVHQPFSRLVQEKDYKHSPAVLELGRVLPSGEVEFLSEGDDMSAAGGKTYYADREVVRAYPEGEYFARVNVRWLDPQRHNYGTDMLTQLCSRPTARTNCASSDSARAKVTAPISQAPICG